MPQVQRGIPLVERAIERLKSRAPAPAPIGASPAALDALESKLMVELPPTLRHFLTWDFTFASLGPKWKGTARFGPDPRSPKPRMTSVRKLAEAKTHLGWTESRIRTKVVRLPSLPGQPWSALHLGEARRDGELVILGFDNDETHVRVYPRYTAFDLYLADQLKLFPISENQRLDDLDSHLSSNPELGVHEEEDDEGNDY
ncbi:MAG: SMI1/KNR4 family protein [Polyangiaceae bacterium]